MSRACSTNGRQKRCTQGFWGGGGLRERDHLEDLDVDGIKIYLTEVGWDGMKWIDLARERDSCEFRNELSGSVKFLD